MTTRQLNRACHTAAHLAKSASASLRTRCGTASPPIFWNRTSISAVIQVLLGHAKLETTALYTRVATKTIREVTSPLERLTRKPRKNEPPT